MSLMLQCDKVHTHNSILNPLLLNGSVYSCYSSIQRVHSSVSSFIIAMNTLNKRPSANTTQTDVTIQIINISSLNYLQVESTNKDTKLK